MTPALGTMGYLDELWVREAERLHRRYLVEVVEAFGLCPWAQSTRLGGRSRVTVVLEPDAAIVAPSLRPLDVWADDEMDIGFLVYPRLRVGRGEFDSFVASLRSTDAARHPLGGAPFVLAAFHPDAEPNLDHPDRLVPFLRRTPDPCVQAVRATALDRVRRGAPAGTQFVDIAWLDMVLSEGAVTPPLGARIARANLETVRRTGVRTLSERFDAIQRDRETTYLAIEAREVRAAPPPAARAGLR